MKNIFEIQHTVSVDEIDDLQHVNNIVYLQWVQEVSGKHWFYLTKNNKQDNYIWVVLRHEIDYLLPAIINDNITLKTWVGKTFGVKSVRYVDILKGDKILAKAKTTWCLLDSKTFRPARIPEEITNILQPK